MVKVHQKKKAFTYFKIVKFQNAMCMVPFATAPNNFLILMKTE